MPRIPKKRSDYPLLTEWVRNSPTHTATDWRSSIPVLSEKASKAEVKSYLRWLAGSEYEYHIDDTPNDLIGMSVGEAAILCHNHAVMWEVIPSAEEIWEYYYRHVQSHSGE